MSRAASLSLSSWRCSCRSARWLLSLDFPERSRASNSSAMSLARSRARTVYERCIRRTATSGRGRKSAKGTTIATPARNRGREPAELAHLDVILDEEAEEGAHEREHAAHETARAEPAAVGADRERDRQQPHRRHPDVHRQADGEHRQQRQRQEQQRDEVAPWVGGDADA